MAVAGVSAQSGLAIACAGALPFLNCEGDGFDPQWRSFRGASSLRRDALLRRQVAQPGEALAPADSEGNELFWHASSLAEQWWPVYTARPEVFDLVLKRRRAAADLQGLCFYGLVTAIFLRAQHICEVLGEPQEALKELEVALSMLGGRRHLDFAREASLWPFDAWDLQANSRLLLSWLNSGRRGAPTFALSVAGERGRPPAVVHQASPWTFMQRHSCPSSGSRGSPRAAEQLEPLGVVVFGVHSTLVLEPATMLRVALHPRPVRVRIYMRDCPRGNAVWSHHCQLQCHALGECNAPEGTGRLFVDLIHRFEDVIHGDGSVYYSVADYLELLVQMYNGDEQMRDASLFVCTAPLVCSLLRAAFEKPLLAYLGMQLHVAVDRQKDQLWLMHFREMVRNSGANIFVVHNFQMRQQMLHATGARLQVVRPRALYAHHGVPLWRLARVHAGPPPGRPAWNSRALLFRSSYFKVSLFLPLLEAHLEVCDFPLQLRVVRNSSDFVTFQELRRYRAAVLFPWDPALMAFWELYSLGGPAVLLPRKEWAFKIQALTGWIWSMPSGAVGLAGLDELGGKEAARDRPSFAHSPWWKTEESFPEQALYWYTYSDYERLPHLLRFGSIAELLSQLLGARELRKKRAGMRRAARRGLQAGLRWYRKAVAWLLSGDPAASRDRRLESLRCSLEEI